METERFSSFQGQPKQLSPLALAFIGDGVFELLVRGNLLKNGNLPTSKLHQQSVEQVNATAQAHLYDVIITQLSEAEGDILRRGRNANVSRVPKSSTVADYHKATAVEALFGYLYLSGELDRISHLFSLSLPKEEPCEKSV